MSANLQHYNEFAHVACLCLLLLPMSNPFFLRGKIRILSRHQTNKPKCILPEIRNFFYHVPSYSSPFWCTWSKRIWGNARLKLCDLHWMPVSCWEESKGLDSTWTVLNSFGPGRRGEVTSHSKMWRSINMNNTGVPREESFGLGIIFTTSASFWAWLLCNWLREKQP